MSDNERYDLIREAHELRRGLRGLGMDKPADVVHRLYEALTDDEQVVRYGEYADIALNREVQGT